MEVSKLTSFFEFQVQFTFLLTMSGYTNIFALGDVMELYQNEIKLAHTAELNACLTIKNISLISQKKAPLSFPVGISHTNSVPLIMVVSLVSGWFLFLTSTGKIRLDLGLQRCCGLWIVCSFYQVVRG